MKNIINQNMDYLRELAMKQSEQISNEFNEQLFDAHIYKDLNNYIESDSNKDNNTNNIYPEEESNGNEKNDENNFEYEKWIFEVFHKLNFQLFLYIFFQFNY